MLPSLSSLHPYPTPGSATTTLHWLPWTPQGNLRVYAGSPVLCRRPYKSTSVKATQDCWEFLGPWAPWG